MHTPRPFPGGEGHLLNLAVRGDLSLSKSAYRGIMSRGFCPRLVSRMIATAAADFTQKLGTVENLK